MDFDDLIEGFVEEIEEINNDTVSSDSKEDVVETPTEETSNVDNFNDDQQDDESEEQPISKANEIDDEDVPIDGYYNFLKQYGVLDVPEDFKFDGTPESLEQALLETKKNTATKVLQDVWEGLPDDFKPLLEYGLAGGKSLQDYLRTYGNQVKLETLDLNDEENQKLVIREYYRQTTQKNDEQIDRMLTRLETMGGLDEEAQDALEYLQEYKETAKERLLQKAQAEEKARIEQAQKEIETLKSTIQTTNLDDTRKRRVEAFMLQPIKEGTQVTTSFDKALDQILNNPQHLVQLADILADYHPSKGIDLNRIETKIKTQNNKTFKQLLNESVNNSKPTGNSTRRKTKEDFDWDGFLNS